MWCFTGAAKAKAESQKAGAKKSGKAKAQARNDISGDEAARSAARPTVSRVTRSQKNLDAGSDTATTHALKRGRKAASKSIVAASLEAVDSAVEEEAGAPTELSDAAPSRAGRPASKHPVEQAPAAVADQADSTAVDPCIDKVQGGSKANLAAAASTHRTGGKLSRKAAENANAAAEHVELGEDQTVASGAGAQVATKKKGRKKSQAAAEARVATTSNDAAKAGAAEGGVKPKKKRGRPAKHAEESSRHVRQKRVPTAAGVASKSVYDYDS